MGGAAEFELWPDAKAALKKTALAKIKIMRMSANLEMRMDTPLEQSNALIY
jgi:hypothetical protein